MFLKYQKKIVSGLTLKWTKNVETLIQTWLGQKLRLNGVKPRDKQFLFSKLFLRLAASDF